MLCIHCLGDRLENGVDLCDDCIDEKVDREDGVIHIPTHELLKVRRFVYDRQKVGLMSTAGDVAKRASVVLDAPKRVKASIIDDEHGGIPTSPSGVDGGNETGEPTESNPVICSSCREPVTRPCWFCMICEGVSVISINIPYTTNPCC
jgi:hypothetical protein